MEIHEFVDEGLGHSSYLVNIDGQALVIDPPRFSTAIEELARRLDTRVTWTADTHSHADYVTGSPALATRVDATFLAPAASQLEVPHRPLADNEVVQLGESDTLQALATPGHTPDHMVYLLCHNDEPVALFSGGSLMVGAVGRTDLMGTEQAEALAHQMFHSLKDRILTLPDELPVYPTHGAGSFCSVPGASERTTTIGAEKQTNPILGVDDEETFVDDLLSGFGTFPTYFARLPELNRHGPRPYDTLPDLTGLSLDDLTTVMDQRPVIVDARPIDAFAAAHIPGSLSNTLRGVFASWLGWLVDLDRPLVFVLDDDQGRDELVRQCLDVGHEHLIGELAGGIDTWRAADGPLATIPVISAHEITGTVLDVRQAGEYRTGHLPDARNIELGAIPATPLPDGPVTVMCGHGERAMTAASVLAQRGHTDLRVLGGGPDDWANATGEQLESTT